jgi:hypothetical protein
MPRLRTALRLVLAGAMLVGGCSTYRDRLSRGQQSFERNDHERTLALLRDLEPDLARLSPPERARYASLRGMTDYRLGDKLDARHWRSVAQAYEETSPGVLPTDWSARTTEALAEVNAVVYAGGLGALAR